MEIVIQIPQDINKLCRTCMTVIKEGESENVFASQDDRSSYLSTMLKYVTGLNVKVTDELPSFMCNVCVNKLHIAYAFKEQCESTYVNFQEIISSSDEKVSSESKSIPDLKKNLSCQFCSHSSPNLYQLNKHLINHNQQQTLYSRFLLNRKDKNYPSTESQVSAEIIALIDERKQLINVSNSVKIKDVKHQCDVKPDCKDKVVRKDTELVKMCDLCDRIFYNDLRLSLHFVTHALLVESDTDPNIFEQYLFCVNCGQAFESKTDLEVHIDECPVEYHQSHECLKCTLSFNNELDLLKHEKYVDHNSDYFWDEFLTKSVTKDAYSCPECGESFPKKNDLNLHSVKHVIKKILCRLCKKLFCTQVAYNEHLRTHPNYRHVCDICGKCLGSKHALKMHVMGVHSTTKNFACDVCAKAFKTPSRLYIHKLTHKAEKKFICCYCVYRTNNIGDFKVHVRTHTSERPYKCNFVNCAKKFKTSSHLNEHIQRHLQIKKFQCTMCDMVFGHSHTLKMHLMVHTGEKPFVCQVCNAPFRRKHHLKNHMKQHNCD